jgi:hypothetical protein
MRTPLAALLFLAPALPAADSDVGATRDRQAQVRDDTEQLARRLGTMLRVLEHYKLDAAAEKKLLDEAAGTLNGLTRQQMADVIAKLDAAMQAADKDAARTHVDAAYAGHRDALRKLKGLLAQYDAVRDLDTAAARLDKLGRDELELAFRVADILRDSLDATSTDPVRRRRALQGDFPTTRARHEAEEAADLRKEFETVARQLAGLKPGLPAEQQERLDRTEVRVRGRDLAGWLDELVLQIRPEGTPDHRHRDWAVAIDGTWAAAGELQAVAAALRPNREAVELLREARQLIAGLADQVATDARTAVEFYASPADEPKARVFADDAGRLAHSTRAVKLSIAGHADPSAESLDRAARALWAARAAHRQVAPLFARTYQAWAEAQIRQALAALDVALARAEAERSDPLAATKAALQKLEQLIQDQRQVHERTQDLARHADNDAARQQAPQQQELAKRGDELSKAPLPTTARTKELLNESAKAMDAAAKELAERQPQPAGQHQSEALARMEEARKELAKEAQKIEQRRDDMAKLETAGKKLEELSKAEQKLANDAAQPKADSKPLADEQARLTPPTQQVAKDIGKAAPDAAGRVQQAAQHMDEAKDDFAVNKPGPGGEKAGQAAKDLDKAREMVSKALDSKKAQEAIDQAKMDPARIDPAQTAREVAKAMEAANDAAKSAEQAAQSPAVHDLQQRQEKVAEQARESGQTKAATPARNAAKDLKRGDLQEAAEQQQQALNQMDKGELANEQQSILETTKSLAQSQAANQMAQSAVQQAQAQAPQAVQPQLDQAARQLAEAGKELEQAKPGEAGQNQAQAAQALNQALKALQQAAQEMAKSPPPNPQQGQPQGQQPDGKPDPAGKQNAQEKSEQVASGDRTPDGVKKDAKVKLNQVDGDGTFLHLPPRQRELIRQALAEKLPPEYATMIQQYFVNVAKGKPAAKPTPEKKPG